MKKTLLILSIILVLSCSSSDDRQENPFLPNVSVNFEVNLNLPQYNNLNFPGGIVVERTNARGIRGVILYNLNDQQFFAYELSDPNIPPSDCSALNVEGTRASSNCGNDNIYDIAAFGQQISGEGGYPLLSYRATKEGSILFVSN